METLAGQMRSQREEAAPHPWHHPPEAVLGCELIDVDAPRHVDAAACLQRVAGQLGQLTPQLQLEPAGQSRVEQCGAEQSSAW